MFPTAAGAYLYAFLLVAAGVIPPFLRVTPTDLHLALTGFGCGLAITTTAHLAGLV